MTVYLVVAAAAFANVFFKGFQYKNVNSNLYVHTFFTSYLIAICDIVALGLAVKNIVVNDDWTVVFATGTGAAFGMVAAMYVHDKLIGKKHGKEIAG